MRNLTVSLLFLMVSLGPKALASLDVPKGTYFPAVSIETVREMIGAGLIAEENVKWVSESELNRLLEQKQDGQAVKMAVLGEGLLLLCGATLCITAPAFMSGGASTIGNGGSIPIKPLDTGVPTGYNSGRPIKPLK